MEFAKQVDDTEGTGIDTKQLRSHFYWDNNKFSLAINHSESNLLDKVVDTATNFSFGCCFTKVAVEVPMIDIDAAAHALDIELSDFEVGETLFYTRDGWSGLVKSQSQGAAHR